MSKSIFKNKYVLGEGYPWALGTGPYKEIALSNTAVGMSFIPLEFPKELWRADTPRYRLVLEVVSASNTAFSETATLRGMIFKAKAYHNNTSLELAERFSSKIQSNPKTD